ncbi:hypothetical protein Asulf_01463 [Archaeoglobus sulfaticallidus PM70-1]|uniref:Uncharacterized protein n=1 Tax=Archaeoglobus sulfaticallidus PM70-1 TaxID=387631 RepID=N0BLN1_9EURY|nr:hypothetical protein [Archaeoglobus sulfaticallidus]AGK61446.1 hypothetical protein Asulf_01463 [Archaeoglobus sulfaticallidus PM70-1]
MFRLKLINLIRGRDPVRLYPAMLKLQVGDVIKRLVVLKIHNRGMPAGDVIELADLMEGYVGVDIEAIYRASARRGHEL